ncbi:hypothetical protein QM298_03720 [Pseudomonas mendocina]|nr:hypothetical protein [Pseudomonas mendocina]MDV5860081.1 hypothetical protein [Pseudomonas mendocina]
MTLRTCLIMMAALALVSLVMVLFPHWCSEMAAGFIHALSGAMAALALWWGRRATRQGNSHDGALVGLLLGAAATFIVPVIGAQTSRGLSL